MIVHGHLLTNVISRGFIALCKTFQTLMCNRALLFFMLQQCTLFSSHYKHASPAFESLSNLVLNGITSLSLTEFKHFYMSL